MSKVNNPPFYPGGENYCMQGPTQDGSSYQGPSQHDSSCGPCACEPRPDALYSQDQLSDMELGLIAAAAIVVIVAAMLFLFVFMKPNKK